MASAFVPFPRTMAPAAMFPQPVPPFAVPRIPVISLARLMRDVETTPLAAFKKPESDVASVVSPVTFNVPATAVLPALSMVVVAVAPKKAFEVMERSDEDALFKTRSDVVADCPAAGCVQAS